MTAFLSRGPGAEAAPGAVLTRGSHPRARGRLHPRDWMGVRGLPLRAGRFGSLAPLPVRSDTAVLAVVAVTAGVRPSGQSVNTGVLARANGPRRAAAAWPLCAAVGRPLPPTWPPRQSPPQPAARRGRRRPLAAGGRDRWPAGGRPLGEAEGAAGAPWGVGAAPGRACPGGWLLPWGRRVRWGRLRRRPPGLPPCNWERKPRAAAGCQAWAGGRRHPVPAGRGLPGPTRPAAPSALAGSHNVFSQAAQAHVQVLPSAAASGNSLVLPFATRSALPLPAPSVALAEVPRPGLCSLRAGRPGPDCGPGLCPERGPAPLDGTGPAGGKPAPRRLRGASGEPLGTLRTAGKQKLCSLLASWPLKSRAHTKRDWQAQTPVQG